MTHWIVMAAQIPPQRKGSTQPTYVELAKSWGSLEEDTYNISSVSRDGENNGRAHCRSYDGANGPKEGQAVKHFTESLAGLVSEVQSLTEFGATRSVDSTNVFDVGVDARS